MILIERRALYLLACQARRIHHAPDASAELAQAATRVARLVATGALPRGVAQRTLIAIAIRREVSARDAHRIVSARLVSAQN